MALLGTFTKQPSEIVDFDISYITVLLGRADTIASAAITVAPSGLTVPGTGTVTGGNNVKAVISTGTTSVSYTITVKATTSGGLLFEDEIVVLVTEVS